MPVDASDEVTCEQSACDEVAVEEVADSKQ